MSQSRYTTHIEKHWDGYDFFGYILPALMMMCCTLLAMSYLHGKDAAWMLDQVAKADTKNVVLAAIGILLSSYVVGHLVATVSEIVFDRIFVQKITGYPYESLLGVDRAENEYSKTAHKSFVLMFFGSLLALILSTLPLGVVPEYLWEMLLKFLGVFLVLKIAASALAHSRLRRYRFIERLQSELTDVLTIVFLYVSKLFDGMQGLIRTLMGTDNPLPTAVQERIRVTFKERLNIDLESARTDVYWLAYWYVTEKSGYARKTLLKFLSLYGYLRNLSGSFLIGSAIIGVSVYVKPGSSHMSYIALGLFILGVLLSIRYYYIYYNYFSKSVFRQFLVCAGDESDPEQEIVQS